MVEPNLKILLVYFGLLKPNMSIIRRLASLWLSGITVAQVVLYSPTNVYVLARRFLCPVSCLSAVSEDSRSIYDSKASVLFLHICTCRGPANRCNYAGFTFARSAGPPGDQNVSTYNWRAERANLLARFFYIQVNKKIYNLEREYRDCIKSRRDKIEITRHIMMHQVLYNVHVTLFIGQLHNI